MKGIVDLIGNKELRRRFSADSGRAVDDFAVLHAPEIRAYYRKGGYQITFEEAHQLACKVRRWFRELKP